MGFDALFVGRIDFQDHDVRKKTKTLEFVWETSPNANGTLHTRCPLPLLLKRVIFLITLNTRHDNRPTVESYQSTWHHSEKCLRRPGLVQSAGRGLTLRRFELTPV